MSDVETTNQTAAPPSPLQSERGRTSIADSVVAKISGIACREIPGVVNMGSGGARAVGALRERLPGSSSTSTASQGVNVEVGERQAAIDLDVVVEYGVPIVDVSQSIRNNVANSVERMTGLEVIEVNVYVDDVHVPEDDQSEPERVQ
ncbi:MAG TPA: Asp23/Gls24 family envelope stress response protein [Acidimicrobiales bacterium]|nr:Asp23/Gls24 family envelope stress response protein [Acidimicrobiales bacterium]